MQDGQQPRHSPARAPIAKTRRPARSADALVTHTRKDASPAPTVPPLSPQLNRQLVTLLRGVIASAQGTKQTPKRESKEVRAPQPCEEGEGEGKCEEEEDEKMDKEFLKPIARFAHEDPLLARYQSDIEWRTVEKLVALKIGLPDLAWLVQRTHVTFPWSPGYDALRTNVNRRWVDFPLLIVSAAKPSEVQAAIRFARYHKLCVSLRCGGHSSEGFSLCNGMVIEQPRRNAVTHVREMSSSAVAASTSTSVSDPSTPPPLPYFQCRVEGGSLLGPTYKRLAGQSLALPAGTCPNVGLSGLALAGGLGFMQRACGLTIDNILEVEMVDANGRLVRANAQRNANLFWALRGGGGGNFGVVTAFTLRVLPLTEVVTAELAFDLSQFETVVDLWQQWAPNTNRLISSELNLFTASSLPVEPEPKRESKSQPPVSAQSKEKKAHNHAKDTKPLPSQPAPENEGEEEEDENESKCRKDQAFYSVLRQDEKARLILTAQYLFEYAPLDFEAEAKAKVTAESETKTKTKPKEKTLKGRGDSPVATLLEELSAFLALPSLRSRQVKRLPHLSALRKEAGDPHRRPFVKSRTAFAGRPWSGSLLSRLKPLIEGGARDSRVELSALGPHSEVNRVAPTATAFPHRNTLFWVNVMTYWDQQSKESEHVLWSRAILEAVQPECIPKAAYVAFPDRDIVDYMTAYYGANADRLRAVKARWDPDNFFSFPQSIPLSKPGWSHPKSDSLPKYK